MTKKIIISFLLISLLLPSLVFATPANGLPFGGATPRLTLPTVALEATVRRIADVVFYATVLIAFIMVVWGGVTMATAAGDPSKVDLAKHMILYGLIAIAVGAISWGLVNLVASYIARV